MSTIRKFRMQSAGTAYNLELGFIPETVEVWNYTKWETDATKVKFYWHRGMAAGYALSELCEDTAANHAIETTNGFTVLSNDSFSTGNQTVSGITQAEPPVVTVTSTSGWSDGDIVEFHDIGGMVELNNNRYSVTVINSTTFSLQNIATGDNIDASAYNAFAAGSELNIAKNLNIATDNAGFYGITLGTTVVGANDDVLYIEAKSADTYSNLGDVA